MSNRIGRMSKRRQKIAWRRVVDAKLRTALQPIVGMPYTRETYGKARELMSAAIADMIGAEYRPTIRILHEGVTMAFFDL